MTLKQKLLLTLALTLSTAVQADNLAIPGHFPAEGQMMMPQRGISMDRVLSEFGEPITRNDAVGEPPITEWDYGDFKVYFEFQTVLHTVNVKTLIMPR